MSKEKTESRFNELLSSLNFKTQGDYDLMRTDKNGFIERGSYKATIIDSETGLKYKLQMIVKHTKVLNSVHLNSDDMLIVTNCKNNSSSSITFGCGNNIKNIDNTLHTLRKIIDGDVSYRMILEDDILSISSKHRGHDRITVSRSEKRQIMLYEILLNWCQSDNSISSIDDIEDSFGSILRSILRYNRNLKIVNMVRSNSDCYMGMLKIDSIPFGMVFYLGDNVDSFNTHDRYFLLCWPNTDGMKALMDDDNITKSDSVSYYDSISSMLPHNDKKQSKSYVNYRNISLIEAMKLYLIRHNRKNKSKIKIKDDRLSVKYNDNTDIIEFGSACSCDWKIDEENRMKYSTVGLNTIIDFCSYYCEVYMSSKKVFDFICSKLREDGYDAEFNGRGAILIGDKMKPGLYIDADFTDNFYLLGLRLMRSHYSLYKLEEMNEYSPYVNSGVLYIRSGGADSFMMDNWYRLRMFIDMVEHEIDPTHRTPGIEAKN